MNWPTFSMIMRQNDNDFLSFLKPQSQFEMTSCWSCGWLWGSVEPLLVISTIVNLFITHVGEHEAAEIFKAIIFTLIKYQLIIIPYIISCGFLHPNVFSKKMIFNVLWHNFYYMLVFWIEIFFLEYVWFHLIPN